jgi:hypothetical protein
MPPEAVCRQVAACGCHARRRSGRKRFWVRTQKLAVARMQLSGNRCLLRRSLTQKTSMNYAAASCAVSKAHHANHSHSVTPECFSPGSRSIRIGLDCRLKHAGMTDFGLAVAKTQRAAGNEPQAIQDRAKIFFAKTRAFLLHLSALHQSTIDGFSHCLYLSAQARK